MPALTTNNATALLASGITNAQTSLTLQATKGALFPAIIAADEYFYATLTNVSNQTEIVKVTARVGDVFTMVRAQDGTVARAYSAGDRVELRPVAALFDSKESKDQKDKANGYVSLTGMAISFWNALNSFKSLLTNANTAVRTYLFQDRDGTIADLTDIATRAALTGDNTLSGNNTFSGSNTFSGKNLFTGTGFVGIPSGSTIQRAGIGAGFFRFNTTLKRFEGCYGTFAGVTISSIVYAAGVVTVTTATAHGRATNDMVSVEGAIPVEFNGTYPITVTATNAFTFVPTTPPTTIATAVGSYTYGVWSGVGSGATGGGNDEVFIENGQTVTSDYTLTAGKNAFSTGPITINTGVTVTVPTGSTWLVQ
jgi:hypothetical protein